MKKPRLHVLVRGFLHSASVEDLQQVSILDAFGKPAFQTSHQAFHSILVELSSKHGKAHVETVDSLSFTIHSYDVNPFQSLHCVTLRESSPGHKFAAKRVLPTKQSRLPFGLQFSPRKRKPKAARPAEESKDSQRPSTKKPRVSKPPNHNDENENIMEIERELAGGLGLTHSAPQRQHGHVAVEPAKSQSESMSGSASTDSSSDSSESSSAESSESSDSSSNDEGLAEKPHLDPDAKEEEKQVDIVTRSHQERLQAQGETFCPKGLVSDSDCEKSGPGAKPSPNTLTPASTVPVPHQAGSGRGSSYCNPYIGVVSVGVQVSARLALCRGCNSKIAQGAVRFGYAYSKSKFEAYVHSGCISKYLKDKNANMDQVREFVDRAKQEQQPPCIRDAIVKLEGDLN